MTTSFNLALVIGAALSMLAALAHVGCIIFGASWYRFFGAGERMARMADAGDPRAALITSAIVITLSVWSMYALSAAGVIGAWPMRRMVLCAITGIYLLRGFAGVAVALFAKTEQGVPFWWWSSAVCLVFGGIHAAGLMQVWARL